MKDEPTQLEVYAALAQTGRPAGSPPLEIQVIAEREECLWTSTCEAPAPITVARLEELGACASAVARFREVFGETAPLTVAAAVKNANSFTWDWAARHLLPPHLRADYNRARAALFATLYLTGKLP